MYYILKESYEDYWSEEVETTTIMISRDFPEINAIRLKLIDIEKERQDKHYKDCILWGMLEKEWIKLKIGKYLLKKKDLTFQSVRLIKKFILYTIE